MPKKWIAGLLGLLLTPAGAGAAAPADTATPLSVFLAEPTFDDARLSPDGQYIAIRTRFSGSGGIAVLRTADRKVTSKISMGEGRVVADYQWAGPHRLVIAPAYFRSGLERPARSGELIGMDADGRGQRYLYGAREDWQTGTSIHKNSNDFGAAEVIGTLPDDPKHVVVAVRDFHRTAHGQLEADETSGTDTYWLDVDNGERSKRGAPPPGYSAIERFLPDSQGNVRYAVLLDPHSSARLTYFKARPDADWQLANTGTQQDANLTPMQFAGDDRRVFLRSDELQGRAALFEQNLETGERRVLSQDPQADVAAPIYSFDGRELIGALYENGKTRVVPVQTPHPDKNLLLSLQESFPGKVVVPVSQTRDGRLVLLEVYSDRDPGSYYLFEPQALKASPFAAKYEGIRPEQMAERRALRFRARDGLELGAYLTLPPGRGEKKLPMVVLVHGGPYWIADQWRWDPDAELLASRGYAVLQVNFRGSGGYGKDFVNAGRKRWSTLVDDIDDGAHWAIAQGYADPQRLCIYGASFGGYAALMAATKEPDLYRCTIGYAGVYDLNTEIATADTADSRYGRNYTRDYIGTDAAALAEASPITHLDQLKAAVMIAHGRDDERVPFAQAQALRKALDKRHYPYEWFVRNGEEHGFYKLENRVELYEKILAFLDRNIGAAAQPAVTTAVSPPQPNS